MNNQSELLIKAIENFNNKFNTQSPFEWVKKIEELEILVDSVKVVKPVNWLIMPEDIFYHNLYSGKTAIISPVQAWEQNNEKIAKYFPDFSKADLPIQVAITKCFFYCLEWITEDRDCLFGDHCYTKYTDTDRTYGAIPVFHYMDGVNPKKTSLRPEYFSRKIFKGRAKGSLAIGFFSGVRVLSNLLNSQKKNEFFFYWTITSIIKEEMNISKGCQIEKSTLIKINDELYEAYHNSPNPYNKKLINDLLEMAREWMPVCKYIHQDAYSRFWKWYNKNPTKSFIDSYLDLQSELSLSNEEILRKYDERLLKSIKTANENKSDEHCF